MATNPAAATHWLSEGWAERPRGILIGALTYGMIRRITND